ncbi:processed acidic surface protein [Niallia sp. XMNu-256]|uniref:processed acidic surface protein n=1 Tax=Niallia sp. XMNu-256 TaxID=3082444 RepID=UPI0030D02E42
MKKVLSILFAVLLLFGLSSNLTAAAQNTNFEQDLTSYLEEVSSERGFIVTKEDIQMSLLSFYDESLESYESVEELSEFLGEVIKADLSNLQGLFEDYELDKDGLQHLLQENGENLDDYIFLDDLDNALLLYTGDIDEILSEIDEEMFASLLSAFQEEIGLTNEELQKLENHILSLEEHLSKPETAARLEKLGNRMMAFGDFDVVSEITAQQMGELVSIYEEFMSIFQLKASFSLVNGTSETPLSLWDLMKIEELKGANLKVLLYSASGQFLADLLITGEMVESDTIIETGKQIEKSAEEVTKVVKQAPVTKSEKQAPVTKSEKQNNLIEKKTTEHKTVKGAKLPKTASDYIPNALLGMFIMFAGIFMFRKVRNM